VNFFLFTVPEEGKTHFQALYCRHKNNKKDFLCSLLGEEEQFPRHKIMMASTSTTLRDLAQWTSPSVSFMLHPLVVAGHRRSVTPYNGVSLVTGAVTGAVGWADEARLVRRQTGTFGHPAYWAWVGALEGAIDVLLTASSLYLEETLCPPSPPAASTAAEAKAKASPYTHSWQLALLAASERLAWTFITRPLRTASNRLHAQLVRPFF
jgi:hypothetical protein